MKLNFFNFEKRGTQYFLTNDLGLYTYLSDADFQHLVNEDFESLDALTLTDLKNKYFIYGKLSSLDTYDELGKLFTWRCDSNFM